MGELIERTVTAAGGACRVWEKGEGERVGVFFGLGGCPRWTPFLELLSKSRRVVVPSLPGFQGSDVHHRQLDGHLDWITATLELIEASDLVGADLVAASVGGMLCAEAAALSPPTVRRLVLAGPYGLFDADDPTTDVFAMVDSAGQAARTRQPERYLAIFSPPEDADEASEWGIGQYRANEASARIIWPLGDRGLRKRLHRITAPTLLLWGDRDELIPPSYAAAFAARITAPSTTQLIAAAGHLVLIDQPEASANAVLEFLAA